MKKIIIAALCAIAAFASCEKGTPAESPLDLKNWQVYYDGNVYDIDGTLYAASYEKHVAKGASFSCSFKGKDANGNIEGLIANMEIDLAKPNTDYMRLMMTLGELDIYYEKEATYLGGHIGDQEIEGSAFSNGSIKVTVNDKTKVVTLEVDGVLKNGKRLAMKAEGTNTGE